MRLLPFASAAALLAAPAVVAEPQTVSIYIQPLLPASNEQQAPSPIAEVSYDIAASRDADAARVVSYEAPDIPPEAALVRIGIWDPSAARWASSTSVASVQNLAKGYSPHFVLAVDGSGSGSGGDEAAADGGGRVVGASLRGVRIDAGWTRDFGPQAVLVVGGLGKQPELNKPVVLSPEGKKVVQEEKTFFQKYWWVIAIFVLVTMTGGGGDGK